jgi:hypothetical protein
MYTAEVALCDTKFHEDSNIKILPQKFEQTTNSGALDRQRTIPTEQPPLVGEVSASSIG